MNRLKKAYAAFRIAIASYSPCGQMQRDTGYQEMTIGSDGEPKRRVSREANSDVTRISEVGPDGRWTTRSVLCEKIR